MSMFALSALSLSLRDRAFFVDNAIMLRKFLEHKKEYVDIINSIDECYSQGLNVTQASIVSIIKEFNYSEKASFIATKAFAINVEDSPELIVKEVEKEFLKIKALDYISKLEKVSKMQNISKTELIAIADEMETIFSESIDSKGTKILEAFDEYKNNILHNANFYKSNFMSLDFPLQYGLRKKDTICIAGDTGMGKTALMLQLADMYALEGYNVGFFTIEMGKDEIVDRLMSRAIGRSTNPLKHGNNIEVLKKVIDKTKIYYKNSNSKLFVHDDLFTFLDIRSAIKHNNYDIVFIDYWQLLDYGDSSRRFNTRNDELAEISRKSKLFAKAHHIPIIWGGQLRSKQVEQTPNCFPNKSMLRDSTSIANDVSVVMLIYRPEYYNIAEYDGEDTAGNAYLIYDKNRHGVPAIIKTKFIGGAFQFLDVPDVISDFKKKLEGR